MRRSLVALALAFVPALVPAQATQGVRVRLPGWVDPVLMDTLRQDHEVEAAPAAVYAAVQKVFADLDIPKGNSDPSSGIIGSEKFERMRRLMNLPMSRSFSCGEGAAGAYADSFRMTIAVVVWVAPGPKANTKLSIAAAAAGQDISGSFKNPRECGSTGLVETKILEGVEKYLK